MKKKYYLLYIMALLFFSCFGSKKNEVKNDQPAPQEKEQVVTNRDDIVEEPSFPENDIVEETPYPENALNWNIITEVYASDEEIEEMKTFLYENDKYIKKYKVEITFISKANFGIPGGDNWIVRLSDSFLPIYVRNGTTIERKYNLYSFNLEEYSNFNIMRDIPGTRIGNSTSSIGDFNGDGIDEIFEYGFYGSGFLITFWGYDLGEDDFVNYCGNIYLSFRLIDKYDGPAPAEFMTYKGMYGFKAYRFISDLGFSPTYHPDPNPKNNKWFFYTWSAEQREYVEVGEVE
ncbi:MAG: hypothetical protein LBV17_11570 [Treponema sp.]|jgi:hypothetical protein|nr:hypothetical protein [Treponema sp.]